MTPEFVKTLDQPTSSQTYLTTAASSSSSAATTAAAAAAAAAAANVANLPDIKQVSLVANKSCVMY